MWIILVREMCFLVFQTSPTTFSPILTREIQSIKIDISDVAGCRLSLTCFMNGKIENRLLKCYIYIFKFFFGLIVVYHTEKSVCFN